MITKSFMVRVGADTKDMERGLKSAEARMQKFGERCTKIGRGMTVAGAAIVGALGMMIKGYINAGDEVHKMALRTSFSTEALSELKYAAEISGATLSDIEKGVKKMSKTIVDATDGLTTYVRAFDRIGLKAEELIELSPEEQFDKIARAIANVESPTIRAAAAQDIFGRAGTKLLPLFAAGEEGLENLKKKAHELGIVFDQEAANKAARLADAQTTLKRAIQGLSITISENIVPVITELVEKLSGTIAKVKDWAKAHPELVTWLTKTGGALGVVMLVLGPMVLILPKVIAGITAIKTACIIMTGPAGIAAAALLGIAISIREIIKTHKEAVKAMSDMALEAAVMGNAAKNFQDLWITVRKEGGETLEQFEELMKRFGGNWDMIMKTIIADPKFAVLKAILIDIVKGVRKVTLEGKDLSIELPEQFRKAADKSLPPFISWATRIAKIFHDVSVRAAEMRAKMKDIKLILPPAAVTMPKFTLETEIGTEEFETFGEWFKAWVEGLMEKWQTAWQAAMEGVRNVVGALDSVFGQFHANEAMRIDNEERKKTEALASWYEQEKAKIESTIMDEEAKAEALAALEEKKAEKQGALEEKIEKQRRKLERKRAKAQKAGGLFAAGINMAEAITKAFTAGPIIGKILAAATAVLCGIQVAAIASAPLPALQRGGRIEGPAIVGEAGPELFVPGRPGMIIPLRREARAEAFTFSPTVNIYAKYLDDRTIDRAAEKIFARLEKEKGRYA